jgi:hypothetical protein
MLKRFLLLITVISFSLSAMEEIAGKNQEITQCYKQHPDETPANYFGRVENAIGRLSREVEDANKNPLNQSSPTLILLLEEQEKYVLAAQEVASTLKNERKIKLFRDEGEDILFLLKQAKRNDLARIYFPADVSLAKVFCAKKQAEPLVKEMKSQSNFARWSFFGACISAVAALAAKLSYISTSTIGVRGYSLLAGGLFLNALRHHRQVKNIANKIDGMDEKITDETAIQFLENRAKQQAQ